LEALVLTHAAVADCAVIPSHDEGGEEVPKAYVVVKVNHELTGDELMAWVSERVAPFKKIRQVEFINAIPKSASGKILRRILVHQNKGGK
jgi:acyl-coenzyme A synthetase/AMP-(fatty) acid ligase